MSSVSRATTLAHLASGMPTSTHFHRHHYTVPHAAAGDWTIDVETQAGIRTIRLDALQTLPTTELQIVLECAGHRRAEFDPAPAGIAWGIGAVSEARWRGVPLSTILADVDVAGTSYVVLEGADRGAVPFARALPLERALHADTLLAWEMNGEPVPAIHGGPVRTVVPGWYATDSVKWLRRVVLMRDPFTGPHEANEYRFRTHTDREGRRLTTLPVHALLTSHASAADVAAGAQVLRGVAWGGAGGIATVEISLNGSAWRTASLTPAGGPYALTPWELEVQIEPGWSTVAVRATDGQGRSQPEHPEWNEGGYANASWHRVRLHAH